MHPDNHPVKTATTTKPNKPTAIRLRRSGATDLGCRPANAESRIS